MQIKYKNGGWNRKNCCVICLNPIVAPNILLKYHISYNPPLVILACKHCNWIEMLLRTGKHIPMNQVERAKSVIKYHQKFNIKL